MVYISKNISLKENGKIDGKSLATALVSLNSMKNVSINFVRSIKGFQDTRNLEIEYEEIISQMEEKVYPLKGAENAFNSIKIENFNGEFYPKKNYETGEIEFGTKIKVPEFSMKRGDIVLLSGESGAGKRTFLRLLKRGDINNRKCIKLDNNQEVDNLGNEYISFRTSIDLGDEKNVMLLLTTHRLDLAEDLATKRYHINKDGVLEQVPIANKNKERDE